MLGRNRHGDNMYYRPPGPEQRLQGQAQSDFGRLIEALIAPADFIESGLAEALRQLRQAPVQCSGGYNQPSMPAMIDYIEWHAEWIITGRWPGLTDQR